jgi:Phytanoyl-CoA dioxygenase (PhyH)
LSVAARPGTMNGVNGPAEFFERGWVRLTRAFDPSGLAEALWRELSAHGPRPDDRVTWRQASSQSLAGKWLTKFGQSGVFAGVGSGAVSAALDELLGDGWTGQAGGWGRPLVTFPVDGDWEIPASGWHLDSPPAPCLPAVRMFAYLSEVPGRGGGTLVVEGSHRLAAGYPGAPSRTVRGQLSQLDPWLREIWHPAGREDRTAALMDHGAEVAGVWLRVAELTGAPGDIVLWHPALIHAAAPNTARHPRFMLTHTALRRVR